MSNYRRSVQRSGSSKHGCVNNNYNLSAKEAHQMTAQKKTEAVPPPAETDKAERKPWKKRTPVEIVLDQIQKVKDDVAKKEDELKIARRQLQKLEEARKLLETI